MPTGKMPSYCWDSCVFISMITKRGRSDEELENLCALERLSDDGGCNIFTASITLVEVLACKMRPNEEAMFMGLLQRSNVTAVSVTPRIAAKAREIRNYYAERGMKIAVPDAIHLATAAHFNATALHTYDGAGKKPKRTDLLRLETPLIEKWSLAVTKPEPPKKPAAELDFSVASGSLFGADYEHRIAEGVI